MSRKIFTEEQQQLLRQNPYIYSVTDTRINLTKEFKEIFLAEYKSGTSPRKILEDHGFDISIIGERRIWSISNHIRVFLSRGLGGVAHEQVAPMAQTMRRK